MSNEESYYIILRLLENYDCKKMYKDVASIKKQLFVHDHLVKKFLPYVSEHLQNYVIESLIFSAGWYMTLFSSVLPFQYFQRIMDIFFFEKWKIIYRVALAILKLKKKRLLAANTFEQFFRILKDFSGYENNVINQDKFFKVYCKNFIFSKSLVEELGQQFDLQNPSNSNKKQNQPLQRKENQNKKTRKQKKEKQRLKKAMMQTKLKTIASCRMGQLKKEEEKKKKKEKTN